VIIGSGFGGSVAALRAAEKRYRVVMESGKRWKDADIPKTQWDLAHFVWFPAAELYGVQRIEYLDDVLVLSGAGVGGGSHVCEHDVRPVAVRGWCVLERQGHTGKGGIESALTRRSQRRAGAILEWSGISELHRSGARGLAACLLRHGFQARYRRQTQV
jgi:choline dehydrogenase-like flavoprotein